MTRNGKILIGSVVVAGAAIGFLVYRKKQNQKRSALLMAYVNELPKMNTTAAVNSIVDTAADNVKYSTDTFDVKEMIKGNPIIFDGKSYKDAKAATAVATAIAKELNAAMSTFNPLQGGTDLKRFENAFKRIGSKNAMIIVNAVYKVNFKESMWEAISNEDQLYYGKGVAASLQSVFTDLPKYNPIISNVLLKLK